MNQPDEEIRDRAASALQGLHQKINNDMFGGHIPDPEVAEEVSRTIRNATGITDVMVAIMQAANRAGKALSSLDYLLAYRRVVDTPDDFPELLGLAESDYSKLMKKIVEDGNANSSVFEKEDTGSIIAFGFAVGAATAKKMIEERNKNA